MTENRALATSLGARHAWPEPLVGASGRILDTDAGLDRGVRFGAALALWLSLSVVTYWWYADGGGTDLAGWQSGLTSAGRVSGLWAADLLLVQLLLMARLPPLEHAFGRYRLARIHRLTGFASFNLMVAHLVLIVAGYAGGRLSAVPATAWDLVLHYGGVLLAVAGITGLTLVVITSLPGVWRRLRYESWHLLHLYGYLGAGLALPHQLWNGQEFIQRPAAAIYWWTLWAASVASVLSWRVGLPLHRNLQHRLRVDEVVREAPGVVSVHLTGRRLDRLPLRSGQFLNVRFLSGTGWTRSNPFSLSVAPNGDTLRLTAKTVGEGSARLAQLPPGTGVILEGPYGRLTGRARTRPRVLLAGAGVGITPLRALAEGLAYAPGEAVLLHRFTANPLFAAEFDTLAATKGLRLLPLPGPRLAKGSVLGQAGGGDELGALRSWIPDLAEHDAYLCGPAGWTLGLARLLLAAGIPRDRIHTETFEW